MSKKCIDCIYAKPQSGISEYYCTKTGRRFNYRRDDPDACGQFRSDDDDCHSCWECEYFTKGLFGTRCAKTGDKINEDDGACYRFIES